MKHILRLALTLLFFPLVSSAQSVDLMWQGETYTPPFYKGSSIWSYQSQITFLAIPQGLGNPSSLAYRWILNGRVLGSVSGTGKNTYTYVDSVLSKPQTIRVEILAYDHYEEPILASRSVTVTPVAPQIAVYENSPLYGYIFHQEVFGNYRMDGEEVTFGMFPLFFEVPNISDPRLTYTWQTNSGVVGSQPLSTFRVPNDERGASRIYTNITNTKRIMQGVKGNFLVQFGEENE